MRNDKVICDNCGKEFEYNIASEIELWDFDYDGNMIRYVVTNCIYCGERTKLYNM